MLEDSKLPTTFWAEAINTACYVQNRVLVVKPHFKTPYELFKGRSHALSFMRPFGCHVSILNTLDQLGKFDGKSNKGIFVGYSTTSKAFRVYNIMTRKVEENLHITFLKNKPLIAGGGPEWLFDLDVLSKSMNYAPVSASTNSNDFAGKGASFDTVNTTTPTYADSPNDPLMPDLEDVRIFNDVYNDRDGGAKVDYNNLETVISVSPVPSIRIHKDHPKEHIIEEVNSSVQTKKMAKQTEAEEVYVSQPPGFVGPEFPNRVYKVEKAFYGLHQVLRAWYRTLSTYLLDNRFRRKTIDKTLFIKKIKDDILLVQVCVDDIIFSSTKRSLSIEFEQLMHKRFQMSSIGELTFFLGLQVDQRKDGIFLSQDKYVSYILKKFDFFSVKSATTPMETHKPLSKDANGIDVDVHLYSKEIFRYLKGQPTLGLWYLKDSPLELIAYSDSDYASASLDKK
uniref:Uncharacterized mitochondrial protein AtMg00810-like n=1 Tax=Tanacetum cinerariifolium TaxID=118510 RepID=A0A699JVJ4_TANCI|nr:uncharacterized mitochondrial protein AtMg00810-like [Tanacetum cinerariifolium]